MRAVVIATLVAGLCASAVHAADGKLIIKADRLVTGTGEVLEPGQVAVEDGRIVAVGAEVLLEGAEVHTVPVLMPGLVDAYSHDGLLQTSERTREFTPELRMNGMINWRDRAFVEHLSGGTTTLHIAPGTDNVFAGIACAAKTAGAVEDRILAKETGLFLSACEDPQSGNGARSRPDSIYIRQPTNRMGVVWILRSHFFLAAQEPGPDPGLQVVAAAMKGQYKPFAVSRTHHDMLAALEVSRKFGMTPVIVGGQESWRIIDDLRESQTSVVLGRLQPGADSGVERTRLCENTAGRLHAAGVPFCLSQGNLLDQARFAVRNGLPPEAAIAAITSEPARILGVQDRVGSVAEGLDADFVALSGDPLEFTTAIRWVMVDGVVQYKQAGN